MSSGRFAEAMALAVLLVLPVRAAESSLATNRPATALESATSSDASAILDKIPGRPDSLDSFFRRDDLPTLAPPRQAAIPRNRSTSVLDDPESWALMTPAQAMEDFVAREILELPQLAPDGRDRSSLSSLERLHEQVSRNSRPQSEGALDWLGIRFSTPTAPQQSAARESLQFENIPSQMAPPTLENLATRRFSDFNLRDHPVAQSIQQAEQERFTEAFRRALNPQPYTLSAPGVQLPEQASAGIGVTPNPLPTPGLVERSTRTAMPQLPGVPRPNSGLPSLPSIPGVAGVPGMQNVNGDTEVDSGPARTELPRTLPGVPQRSF